MGRLQMIRLDYWYSIITFPTPRELREDGIARSLSSVYYPTVAARAESWLNWLKASAGNCALFRRRVSGSGVGHHRRYIFIRVEYLVLNNYWVRGSHWNVRYIAQFAAPVATSNTGLCLDFATSSRILFQSRYDGGKQNGFITMESTDDSNVSYPKHGVKKNFCDMECLFTTMVHQHCFSVKEWTNGP